jgi:uncharacterized protein (TIGR02246 family)
MKKAVILSLAALVAAGCQQPDAASDQTASADVVSPQEAVAQVRQVFERYQADWNASDIDAVLGVLADDAVQMSPGSVLVGKESLAASWREWFEQNTDLWEPVIDEIQAAGDLVFVKGHFVETWTPKSGGEAGTQAGEGVWVFRYGKDGAWKLELEQWFDRDPVEGRAAAQIDPFFVNAEYWTCPVGSEQEFAQATDSIWGPIFNEMVAEGLFQGWVSLVPLGATEVTFPASGPVAADVDAPWQWVTSWSTASAEDFESAWAIFEERLATRFPDVPRPSRFCDGLTIVRYESHRVE